MASIKHDDVLLRLIRDVNDVRSALRRVVATLPLYDIDNENSPAQITANQNNYIPGNFDVLRLTSSAAYSITGIANGVKGRSIQIFNVGAFNITLIYQSGLSIAANRFDTPSGENFILYPQAGVKLYYDASISRWKIQDVPAWAGAYGYSLFLYNSVFLSIPGTGAQTKLTFDTAWTDKWGMWDVVNQKITIPQTGCYMGILGGNFPYNVGGGYRSIAWNYAGVNIFSDIRMAVTVGGIATSFACPYFFYHAPGQTIEVYASQNSGVALNLAGMYLGFSRVR
jgi:hypothetical protein